MGTIINTTDFVGIHKIAQTSFTELDLFITRFEEKYLIEVLGFELFTLFKANLTAGVPTNPIYIAIFNAIRMDDGNCVYQNNGMKSMILGFVWFEYMATQKFKQTASGTVANQIDVAQNLSFDDMGGYKNYNDSVNDANVIQWYINKNLSDYPTFAGQKQEIAHWAL